MNYDEVLYYLRKHGCLVIEEESSDEVITYYDRNMNKARWPVHMTYNVRYFQIAVLHCPRCDKIWGCEKIPPDQDIDDPDFKIERLCNNCTININKATCLYINGYEKFVPCPDCEDE